MTQPNDKERRICPVCEKSFIDSEYDKKLEKAKDWKRMFFYNGYALDLNEVVSIKRHGSDEVYVRFRHQDESQYFDIPFSVLREALESAFTTLYMK